MRSVNKVILVGNLTRDPELKSTVGGQSVCTLGIATNRDWVGKDGQKQSLAEFHEVVAWARLAEICHQFLKKGNLVYVEGYLKTRSWDNPETGKKSYRTEIVIEDMIRLEKRPAGEEGSFSAAPRTVALARFAANDAEGAAAADAFDEANPSPFEEVSSANDSDNQNPSLAA
jgi:single-strand DNA-binding protein